MDYRLWLAGMGVGSVLVMWAFHRAGRRRANAYLLAAGELGEAEVVKAQVHRGRFAWSEVTYTYLPKGAHAPVTVTRKLDGAVPMAVGDRVRVRYLPGHPRVSILVGHETRHDAS